MDMRDKLTLTTSFNITSRVRIPNGLPVVRPLPNSIPGFTVLIKSPFKATSIMPQQQSSSHCDSAKAVDMAKDKAALSFILTSSDSDSEIGDASEENCEFTRPPQQCSMTAATTEASAPARKGSKFCTVEGCTSRAKHAKRCWKHGGSVKCKVPECINRAKSKGVCWSHGGGTVCSLENCDTIAVSNGFCWAHGGGKRCQMANCSKPAYERTLNYCQTHFEELNTSGTGAF